MSKPKRDPAMKRLRGKLRNWRERLTRRRRWLRRSRAQGVDERKAQRSVRKARKAVAGLEARIAKRQARRKSLDHVSVLDGTPCALGLKLALLDARQNGWAGVLNSGDRRTVIARLLHRLGKSTQAELYQLYLEGRGAPANPPDVGTHQRIGDGTVGSYGSPLPWFEQGLDTSDGPGLRRGLRRLGYDAFQPYSNEEWHTNFRTNPHHRLVERSRV